MTVDLKPRQLQCLRLAAAGHTMRVIATRLGVSVTVVNNAQARTRRDLGAHSTAHAVALAVHHGLITAEHLGIDTREDA